MTGKEKNSKNVGRGRAKKNQGQGSSSARKNITPEKRPNRHQPSEKKESRFSTKRDREVKKGITKKNA